MEKEKETIVDRYRSEVCPGCCSCDPSLADMDDQIQELKEKVEKLLVRMDSSADLVLEIEKLADTAFKVLKIQRGG